jgi:hypothetical protein
MLAALATRPPTTKEELYLYAKEVCRFPCGSCKGAGQYANINGVMICPECNGEGKTGLTFSPIAICPDHDAPLDVLWELWSGLIRHEILIASRFAGKTLMLAFLEHMLMRFRHFSIAHMGAVENQANRARDYFHSQVSIKPWSEMLTTSEPGHEKAEFLNGGKIEWLPGTLAQASGPHPELSVLDELDLIPYDVRQQFLKTPMGPRAQFIETSTQYTSTGTVNRILQEFPFLPVRRFCMFESLRTCTYDCNEVPLLDGTVGRCPLYEMEEVGPDGTVRIRSVCGGEKARRSQGHVPIPVMADHWMKANAQSRLVQFLCEKPGTAVGNRAFWAFSSSIAPVGNILPFNPEVQPGKPLEWSMDFNPGINMKMCSFILQQAPEDYGQEWWILDVIALPTAATPDTCIEFLRRYGTGGSRLPEYLRSNGHTGGVWIYGDATGHSRTSAGITSYQIVMDYCKHVPGFRLMVQPGSANPPLRDRLNRANQMLCYRVNGQERRFVKVAPRCIEMIAEFEQMPLGSDGLKDKSDRVQKQLGLSHLSDDFEYWVWSRFPAGPPRIGMTTGMYMAGKTGGQRLSQEGAGKRLWTPGGRRLSADD